MNSRAESAAAALLEEMGVVKAPIAAQEIAEALGVRVVRAKMEASLSGMLIRDGDDLAIGVNQGHPKSRQAFTVAHELGHLRMHRGRPLIVDSMVRVNFRDRTSASATSREEMEANAFAAALLMPSTLVLEAAAQRSRVSRDRLAGDLAARFKVSEQAMSYRLINLGVTSPI